MTLEAVQQEMIEKAKGVGLVVADGGESIVKGDEIYQEESFSQLILCQVLVAVSILARGGKFVLKLVSTRTFFMRDLLYLLALQFTKFDIVKPRTSRPGNSERYLVACGFSGDASDLAVYLKTVNVEMNRCKTTGPPTISAHKGVGSGTSISEKIELGLVGVQSLISRGEDGGFDAWLEAVDAEFLERQVKALEEIRRCHENPGAEGWDSYGITRRVYGEWYVSCCLIF